MFRFLGRLIVALFALLAARLFFAAVRGGARGESAGRGSRRAPTGSGSVAGSPKPSARSRPARIDRSTAEDVPYVELDREPAARR